MTSAPTRIRPRTVSEACRARRPAELLVGLGGLLGVPHDHDHRCAAGDQLVHRHPGRTDRREPTDRPGSSNAETVRSAAGSTVGVISTASIARASNASPIAGVTTAPPVREQPFQPRRDRGERVPLAVGPRGGRARERIHAQRVQLHQQRHVRGRQPPVRSAARRASPPAGPAHARDRPPRSATSCRVTSPTPRGLGPARASLAAVFEPGLRCRPAHVQPGTRAGLCLACNAWITKRRLPGTA